MPPIPTEEMKQWLDATAERILGLSPRRVLEIGCGNGLVLGRIAPAAAEYVGTDFSVAALDVLRDRIERSGLDLPQVTLLAKRADDFSGIGQEAFDTVIVNSVVQYFPGVDYLLRVALGAVAATRPGGAVFVGDVRSLPLLDTLSAGIELFRTPGTLPLGELRQRIRRRRIDEEELLVDPAFFLALARHVPRIRGAHVLPKSGRAANELVKFRYDVVLRVGEETEETVGPEGERLDWQDLPDLEELRHRLEHTDSEALTVVGVPNGRLTRENRALELLDEPSGLATVADLEAELGRLRKQAPEPDDVRALADGLPYVVELSWAAARPDGSFDAVFRRPGTGFPSVAGGKTDFAGELWSRYANAPLLGKIARELEPRLRVYLSRRLPAPMVPSAIVLVDSLPHLPSGKVDRTALGGIDAALARERGRPDLKEAYTAPRTPTEKALARVWSELLGVDRVGTRDNFFQLGGDSILGIRIVARARDLGLEVRLKDLFQNQTVADLARTADSRTGARPARQEPVVGPVALTPIQRWFFEQEMSEPWHYNQSVLLESRTLSAPIVEAALEELVGHHDLLRALFSRDDDGWRQSIASPDGGAAFSVVDLTRLGADRRRGEVLRATSRLHAGLDLTKGPLVRAARLEPDRFFLAVHHLVVDRVSWPILLEDLERACRQIEVGSPVRLPAKTSSYGEWAEKLVRLARSEELLAELPLWRDLLPDDDPGLPVDGPGPNLRASVATCSSVLGAEETRRLLEDLPTVYGSRVTDPLLVALARTFAAWTGRETLLLEMEGHGREDLFDGVDLSRTVGWFTSAFPVFLELGRAEGDEEALAAVRERSESLPHHGIGYGLLRYLSGRPEVAARLRSLPQPQVRLNYMGRIEAASEGLFDFVDDPEGPNTSPRQERGYLLEVNGYVVEGMLHVDWHYSRDVHRRETIEKLAESYLAELRGIVRRCRSSSV